MSGNDSAQRAERMLKCLQLRRAGKSYREIGALLGCEPSTALRDVRAALHEARLEVTAEVKDMEVARYDRYLDALEKRIDGIAVVCHSCGEVVMELPDVKAISTAVSVSKARRELLGLDAPTKTQEVPADEVAKMSRDEKIAAHKQALAELEGEKEGMH